MANINDLHARLKQYEQDGKDFVFTTTCACGEPLAVTSKEVEDGERGQIHLGADNETLVCEKCCPECSEKEARKKATGRDIDDFDQYKAFYFAAAELVGKGASTAILNAVNKRLGINVTPFNAILIKQQIKDGFKHYRTIEETAQEIEDSLKRAFKGTFGEEFSEVPVGSV